MLARVVGCVWTHHESRLTSTLEFAAYVVRLDAPYFSSRGLCGCVWAYVVRLDAPYFCFFGDIPRQADVL